MSKPNLKNIQLFLILVGWVLTFSFSSTVRAAGPAAAFYLSPSSASVVSGSTLTIELRLRVTEDTIHSAKARLTYPSSQLELSGTTPAKPYFVADKTYSTGSLSLTYGSLTAITGDQAFATLYFKVIGSSGNFSVSIDPIIDANNHSYVPGDSSGTGANILNSVTDGNYTITGSATGSPSTTPTATSSPASKPSSLTDPTATNATDQSGSSPTDAAKSTVSAVKGVPTGSTSSNTGLAANNHQSEITLAIQILTLIVLLLILANITRKKRKHRKITEVRREESVAMLEERIKSGDRSKDTVAELAARLRGEDHSNETVAELETRLKLKKQLGKSKRLAKKTRKN